MVTLLSGNPVLMRVQPTMPALHLHHHQRRIDSGSTFSVILGIIAAAVVLACAIWGFLVPRWKRKHAATPSRTKWNNGSILTTRRRPGGRIRIFPSHPAIKPLLSKPSTAQILPTYDPRVESPFPDNPNPGLNGGLPDVVRIHSAPVTSNSTSSDGLFTPARHNALEEDQSESKYHTVPRANNTKHLVGKSADFGDAKDFILAVPEPLALKPREAGRPPAVTRHLEKYGTAHTASPADSDKLPHPNKLFRAIQNGDIRSSLCSSTSLRVDHRESDAAASATKEVEDAIEKAIEEEAGQRQYLAYSSDSSKASTVVRPEHNEFVRGEEGITVMHRLRSYRSLTGSRIPTLSRAGTITKPRTPMDELRRVYAPDAKHDVVPTARLPQQMTSSTALTMIDYSSEYDSTSIPATSPILPPTALQLLPTPLRPRRNSETTPVAEGQILSCSITMQSVDVTEKGQSGVTPLQSVFGRKREKRVGRGFYHAGRRPKPAPLNIQPNISLPSVHNHRPRKSTTGIGTTIVAPVVKPSKLKSRMRASSMYSEDTHGFNRILTPSTPDFPSPIIDIFTDHEVCGNPFTGRESVKARVEEWTQRIHGQATPPLPSSKLLPNPDNAGKEATKAQLSTEGDEANEKRLTVVNDYDKECNQSTADPLGIAPGDAIWI